MRLPDESSLGQVIAEINETDYTDPNDGISSEVMYNEDVPARGIDRGTMNKIMKTNYTEPSKRMQTIYESQFRSFSRMNDKEDSFDNLI